MLLTPYGLRAKSESEFAPIPNHIGEWFCARTATDKKAGESREQFVPAQRMVREAEVARKPILGCRARVIVKTSCPTGRKSAQSQQDGRSLVVVAGIGDVHHVEDLVVARNLDDEVKHRTASEVQLRGAAAV